MTCLISMLSGLRGGVKNVITYIVSWRGKPRDEGVVKGSRPFRGKFSYFKILPSPLFLFSITGPVVWIIGDSIVFWAHRRAKNTGEADLGLGTSVRWLGKRGLRIEGVSDWLDKMGRSEPKPSVVVLHVGTNDIEALSKKKLASLTYRLFDANKGKFQIVWSDILERVWYPAGCTGDQGKLDLKRRAANRYAKALAARFHGKAIPHPSISHNDISLYRTDGLHLADEGLDRFISELKVGLSYLR
uniref:Putative hydrolase n=1 Tax=Lytechinus variegatus TaxID=7654 RepID=Q6IMM6_LYTVA|nr:TPA_exp: putative hydrolase [Lytechinus variegatus]